MKYTKTAIKPGYVVLKSLGGGWIVTIINTPKNLRPYLSGRWVIVAD